LKRCDQTDPESRTREIRMSGSMRGEVETRNRQLRSVQSASSHFAYSTDLIEFLAYGGYRKSEAENIRWADCDFDRSEILVRGDDKTGTKNWTVRIVPMVPETRRILERLKAERPHEPAGAKVMHVSECNGSLLTACRKLGIPRITHHDLRHLFATTCIESGVDVPTVSRWLGHTRGNLRLLLSGEKSSGRKAMPDGTKPVPGGWNRIQLPVSDIKAEAARLHAAGVKFRREDIVSGPGGSQIWVVDPSGNLVELFQPK